MRKVLSIQSLLWLALVLALVGSLRHVAWGFSTLETGDLVAGYVQAVAVDLGLFALAVGIQARRRQERRTAGLWLGVILFSAVSTYANLLHGMVFASAMPGWLATARPFVLSAVLPMLVVYLSEIAASDYQHAAKKEEAERKAADRKAARVAFDTAKYPMPIEQARAIRAANKTAAVDALVDFYAGNPDASMAAAGRAIGRSKTTVSGYLDELSAAGRIERNGAGVKIIGG